MKKKISKAAVLLLSLTLVISLFASCGGGGGDTEGKTSLGRSSRQRLCDPSSM